MMTQAGIPKNLKSTLWAECVKTGMDLDGILVLNKNEKTNMKNSSIGNQTTYVIYKHLEKLELFGFLKGKTSERN